MGMMRNATCAFTLMVAMAGCATAPRVQTASGAPEIDIRADKKIVVDLLANFLSSNGFTIKTANEYAVVAEKPDPSTSSQFLFGTRLAGTPNRRITLNFASFGELVRIRARTEVVSNPGSAFENVVDLSGGAVDVQTMFTELKGLVEGGVIGVRFIEGTRINEVAPGSPADGAGLKKGDVIQTIEGQSVGSIEAASSLLRGEPGTSVEITVLRDGVVSKHTLIRKTYSEVWK